MVLSLKTFLHFAAPNRNVTVLIGIYFCAVQAPLLLPELPYIASYVVLQARKPR
jgi:hypothetical protein